MALSRRFSNRIVKEEGEDEDDEGGNSWTRDATEYNDFFGSQDYSRKRASDTDSDSPDVLAAASDIMHLMTPPKKRIARDEMYGEVVIDQGFTHSQERNGSLGEIDSHPIIQRTFGSPHHPTLFQTLKTPPRLSVYPSPHLPFNPSLVFNLASQLCGEINTVAHTVAEFNMLESEPWAGNMYFNLSTALPFSTSGLDPHSGIERLLQIIFTRFAQGEYTQAVIVLRAEFGADWFTPIMQYPYGILRHVPTRTAFSSYCVFYIGPQVRDFVEIYRGTCLISGVNSWTYHHELMDGLIHDIPDTTPKTQEEDEKDPEEEREDEGKGKQLDVQESVVQHGNGRKYSLGEMTDGGEVKMEESGRKLSMQEPHAVRTSPGRKYSLGDGVARAAESKGGDLVAASALCKLTTF